MTNKNKKIKNKASQIYKNLKPDTTLLKVLPQNLLGPAQIMKMILLDLVKMMNKNKIEDNKKNRN